MPKPRPLDHGEDWKGRAAWISGVDGGYFRLETADTGEVPVRLFVGFDIGCGMMSARSNVPADSPRRVATTGRARCSVAAARWCRPPTNAS